MKNDYKKFCLCYGVIKDDLIKIEGIKTLMFKLSAKKQATVYEQRFSTVRMLTDLPEKL